MPNLQNFAIEFDRPDTVYTPGETVSGRVVFNLSEAKNVREVRLKIRGKAKVFWSESKGAHMDHYRRKEHYFNVINKLAGGETGDEQTTLPAGKYSYPFSIELPQNLPCSFEETHGYVRYTVKVTLDRPWKFDHEILSEFTVLAPYDLSTQEDFSNPIQDEVEKEFSNLCCLSSGIMKFNVSSQKRGFAPGETIELKINYDKSSTDVDIMSMKLRLVKHITFHATYKRKFKEEVLEEVHQNGPFCEEGETSLKLIVPSVPPSNLKHCTIIDVDYKLELTIHVSGVHTKVDSSYSIQLWDSELVK